MTQSAINDYQSSLTMTVYFPLSGIFPSQGGGATDFFLGELGIFAGNFDPAGAIADGQLLPINQNTAVFSILGTTYGGNGTSNFALPNLQNATLIGDGTGPGLPPATEGAQVGAANVTLTTAETPPVLGGTSQPFDNYQPSLPVHYEIATSGVFPSQGGGSGVIDMLGAVIPFAGNFDPGGFLECAGQLLSISQNVALFNILGTTYGGDGITTFALPDLRGRDIVGVGPSDPLGEQLGQPTVSLTNSQVPTAGNSAQPFDNQQPSLAMNYIIATSGIFPTQQGSQNGTTPLLGEIIGFAGNFAPSGWALCDGQLLAINQNQALFSVLGTQYGGDGVTTFALPNLEDRAVIGSSGSSPVGADTGANLSTITTAQLPVSNGEIIVVAEVNVAGVAGVGGVATTASGTAGTGGTGALAGDSDIIGLPLSISAVTGGTVGTAFATQYGTLTLNGDGSYTYSANAASLAAAPTGAPAADTIAFTVTDTNGAVQNATLTITDYRDPVAVGETAATGPGQTITGTAGISGTGALRGDSDPDGVTLTVAAVNGSGVTLANPIVGLYGTLNLNADGSYSYTANSADTLASAFLGDGGAPLVESFNLLVAGPHGTSAASSLAITIDQPPALSSVAASAAYTESGPAVALSPSLTVSGDGSLTLAAATVAITGGTFAGDGDILGVTTTGTAISASYNSATEILTLTGTDTPIDYQHVLDSVTFSSTSSNPANGGADSGRTVTWSVNDGISSSTPATTALSINPPSPGDLTGDGKSDLLMTNTVGALVVGEVGGGAEQYTQIGGLGPEWQFAGTGASFLGDGNGGFLLWDSSPDSGAIVVGEDNGGTAQYTAVGGVGSEWQFEGNGHFLGQAADDFLLLDSGTGALVVGAVVNGSAQYAQIGGLGSEWQFEGTGNYLGDGNSGFLLSDSNSGALVVGEDVSGSAQYRQIGGLGSEWQFEGTGNLLGNGKDDFLIWSNSTGAVVVGEVAGGVAQYTQIGAVGAEWQFLGVGNYDGASASEFLMYNRNSGALVVGTVTNGTANYAQVGGVGSEWNFHASNPATLA